jgi:hypothetical protein
VLKGLHSFGRPKKSAALSRGIAGSGCCKRASEVGVLGVVGGGTCIDHERSFGEHGILGNPCNGLNFGVQADTIAIIVEGHDIDAAIDAGHTNGVKSNPSSSWMRKQVPTKT